MKPEIEPTHNEDDKDWERAMNEGWIEKESQPVPQGTTITIEIPDDASGADFYGYDG